ncbi:hypothetical protein KR018_002455 [Drosophila ironensis]|nr:hypothetical protein KR018_002455 [Drosophila ironensis]
MSVIKSMFLLSLLALSFVPRETEAQATVQAEWSRIAKCGQVAIEALTNLGNKIIPTIYDLKKCSGYQTIQSNGKRKVTWYLRNIYEFAKKLVLDKPKCLQDLLNRLAKALKPYADQAGEFSCLDGDDFFI